jgi:hypothetical protein
MRDLTTLLGPSDPTINRNAFFFLGDGDDASLVLYGGGEAMIVLRQSIGAE